MTESLSILSQTVKMLEEKRQNLTLYCVHLQERLV